MYDNESSWFTSSTEWTLDKKKKKRRRELCLSGASLSMEMMMTCPIFKFLKSKKEKDAFQYFHYFLVYSVTLDSGWTCKPLTEKLMSKLFKGRLLNSHPTFFPRKKDPFLVMHWKKQQLDNISKKWYWLRFPRPHASRSMSLGKYVISQLL